MRAARTLTGMVLPGVLACQPGTTRPPFTALPEAETVEMRLSPLEATRHLADALAADSIPAGRVDLRDGFIESRWFDSASGIPTARRPLGTGVVRVRAWADPGRPGFAVLSVETVYRPMADPSLPARELEHEVPRDHPFALKVRTALQDMVKRYGGPPAAEAPAQPRAQPEDEEAPNDEPAPDQSE